MPAISPRTLATAADVVNRNPYWTRLKIENFLVQNGAPLPSFAPSKLMLLRSALGAFARQNGQAGLLRLIAAIYERFPAGRKELEVSLSADGFAIKDGRISPHNVVLDEVIKEAQTLLNAPGMEGPCRQWEKAREQLATDPENCIKDAVGALEGVVRIISRKRSSTLSQTLEPLARQLGIHPTIREALLKLYAYRGDEQAIVHGATQPWGDHAAEAELILHWCGAAIVYLVKKRSPTPVRTQNGGGGVK